MGYYRQDSDLPDDFFIVEEHKDPRIVRSPSVPKTEELEPLVRFESIVKDLYSGRLRMSFAHFAELPSTTIRKTPDRYALLLQEEEHKEAERKGDPTSLSCFAAERFWKLPSVSHSILRQRAHSNTGLLHGYDKQLYLPLTAGYIVYADDEGANCVFCNLTTRDFVRQDAVVALYEVSTVRGPYADGAIGLCHLLVSLICWSRDPSGTWPDGSDWHQGRWAGDRFEITLRWRICLGEWTDISDTAVKRVREIWGLGGK